MEAPTIADRQQQVWPLGDYPPPLQLGQVQVLVPDAFVASMQVQQQPEPLQLGFMCGSLPVPTCSPADISDITSSNRNATTEAALIPAISLQSGRAAAPRYRVLPTETDLNTPPPESIESEANFPVSSSHEAAAGSCKGWGGIYLGQPVARKCETLAVNALSGYGDDIDVIAPIDILKQIFKTPYSKARISVAVHRIGRTLILNSGPDDWIEERPGGKIGRKKKSSTKSMESALFSKFVQHSMNGSFCDAESSSQSESQDSQSTSGFEEIVDHDVHTQSRSRMAAQRKGKQRVSLGHHCRRNRVGGGGRFVGEQQRETEFAETECPSEGPQRPPSEGFLRVLFWQFQNLRMLLGSDLLLFSNEKHSAVSLHLLEIERQVTPLMWLDAWLDNVMASIPELAICYHRNGVVQGYELLKTDDIFLVKGLAEDGTAFFHPHVVQQNASTVLRFLQDNCKEDPGTYWLLKNSGEDLMQLFDLSVISKPFASCGETEDKDRAALPSNRGCCDGHYTLPLAMLLYRLTNRLARSKDPADRRRCAKLFGKCLEFMDEQEHLTIRASAHEHVARLILSTYEETGSSLKPLLLEARIANATEAKQSMLGLPCSEEETTSQNLVHSRNETGTECDRNGFTINQPEECSLSENGEASNGLSHAEQLSLTSTESAGSDVSLVACNAASEYNCVEAVGDAQVEEASTAAMEPQKVVRLVPATYSSSKPLRVQADSVSAHLEAVHHISQAIKALRWQRQLQDVGDSYGSQDTLNELPGHTTQLCICGEADCVAVCDFKEIGIGAQMDQKLWGLMLLLGDAYLALGHAYKDEGLLSRALKATELACQVCGAMPPVRDVTNSWNSSGSSKNSAGVSEDILRQASKAKYFRVKGVDSSKSSSESKSKGAQQQIPFWGQLWMFVGDVYVEIQRTLGEGDVTPLEQGSQFEELTMTQEVAKEVKRLKKKIGQLRRSCGICSLTSCSCQSDRASSGNSASSCSSSTPPKYGRKQMKKSTKSYSSMGSDIVKEDNEHSLGTGKSTACKDSINVAKQVEVSDPPKLTKGSGAKSDSPEGKSYPSSTNEKFRSEVPESYTPPDIFSFLTRPVTADWESNLSAAVDCYTAAVYAFAGFTECAGNIESSLRKKGWACNELGRKRLAQGQVKSAEASLALAIDSFREVKDITNVVLVHCNLGHGRRAAAEALASKLPLEDDCKLLTPFVQTIAEAKFLYGEALKYYGSARLELISGGVETISGLWHEVHTQLAHTYLRLGMLLAREDRFVYACRKNTETGRFLGSEDLKERKSGMKDAKSTKDAITKALVLYESLGKFRAQEAAYAQFQLACYHRDSCTRAVKQVDTFGLKKIETSIFQKVKLHASLAELYWQKSLDFYKPETHSDMFLDILMERSSLCFMMAECLGQHQMVEQAMSFLLEGRKALKPFDGGERVDDSVTKGTQGERPSKVTSDKFITHLQKVLKSMLSAALMLGKSDPSISTVNRNWRNQYQDAGISGESSLAKASDILKLKDMYRASLQLQGGADMDQLYRLWIS
ncbi:hypothetical protein R1sor_018309 [Riccia sorocarpa]|uniref:EDRF1 N-terminal domain-containing protein n=1 Tax=Riccia sorocarpa TaxID=122646 RepID=A0ABD3IDE3_9MARC